MSAVAVFETLREIYEITPDIKWVNDVHVSDKKIGGILAETSETNRGLSVIVGIGINFTSENFPTELENIATSIKAETGETPKQDETLENLTKQLSKFYEILQSENGAEQIREEWTKRSSYAFGKEVRVELENETIFGTTRGIEENGALRVKTEKGEIKIIQSGDVERLRDI